MLSPWLWTALLSSPAAAAVLRGRNVNANVTCPPLPTKWPAAGTFTAQTTLPDPLVYIDGKTRVKSTDEWWQCRQPEILQMLQEYQYGYYPDHSKETVTATRSGKTISISVTAGGKTGKFTASISTPSSASESSKVPVVINIGGMDSASYISAGIAVVQFDYTSVAPDSNGKTGAFWSLYNGQDIGVLTAWAWGFHRVLDALIQTSPEIDTKKVGVTGCSRLGKAALAAGLFDTRITVTMPMSSGVQGLGPYRYTTLSGQGENLENSKSGAGWWSNSGLGTFVNQATKLPFDAHTIAAAIAPRALIIDQGTGDQFTNSKGTAAVIYPAAKLIYDWLGYSGQIGMGVRSGAHCDNSGYTNILPYVLKIFKGTATTRDYNDIKPYSVMPEAYPWASLIPKAANEKRQVSVSATFTFASATISVSRNLSSASLVPATATLIPGVPISLSASRTPTTSAASARTPSGNTIIIPMPGSTSTVGPGGIIPSPTPRASSTSLTASSLITSSSTSSLASLTPIIPPIITPSLNSTARSTSSAVIPSAVTSSSRSTNQTSATPIIPAIITPSLNSTARVTSSSLTVSSVMPSSRNTSRSSLSIPTITIPAPTPSTTSRATTSSFTPIIPTTYTSLTLTSSPRWVSPPPRPTTFQTTTTSSSIPSATPSTTDSGDDVDDGSGDSDDNDFDFGFGDDGDDLKQQGQGVTATK